MFRFYPSALIVSAYTGHMFGFSASKVLSFWDELPVADPQNFDEYRTLVRKELERQFSGIADLTRDPNPVAAFEAVYGANVLVEIADDFC